MRVVATIARILLGLLFVLAGSNHVYAFMPSPPPPAGTAGLFITAMTNSHYFIVVGLCEAVPGLLLLFNRFVPLALTVLGAVIVNILLTGFLLAPMGIPAGVVVAILWFVVFWRVRTAFAGIFQARVEA